MNLQKAPSTLIIGANGSGKSTMLDALCFVLFNRPFRTIKKEQLVNTINNTDCEIEVTFNTGNKEYKVISKNAMSWVENSKDWMILAQGLKLLEKLSNSDELLKSNVISIARQLKNDERKAVRSQAQKILKDT